VRSTCPHCQQTLDFSGPPPAFCGFCGRPLSAPQGAGSSDTVEHVASNVYESPTLSPETLPTPDSAPRRGSDVHDTPTLLGGPPGSDAAGDGPVTIGGYRLIRQLGEGGMGSVWEAEQLDSGRRVALKLLSERLGSTPETVERFLREARTAASISHPRSTFVFGAGEHAGRPYIVMELMPGRTLADLLRDDGTLPVDRAVDAILDVIEGLQAAHALGLIHRDVKPSNCFLDSDGRVKVGDFGLSKSLVADDGLTRTGAFLGTPQFAAPEQVRGGGVDQRTDIYSVAATLFCLLTGRGPFVGDAAAVIAQIASDPAPLLRSLLPTAPLALERIIARALAKDPAERFSTLAELRLALLPFATGGTSIADLGRRMAAFVIDGLAIRAMALTVFVGFWAVSLALPAFNAAPWQRLFDIFIPTAYFAFTEGCWERGIGKWLMGLRVVGTRRQRAGLPGALFRAMFIPGALGLVALPSLLPHWTEAHIVVLFDFKGFALAKDQFVDFVTHAPMYVFWLACLVTMRKRNGYRGLHEIVSGTRVVRLRSATQGRWQRVPMIVPAVIDGVSEDLGPYHVIGRLGFSGPSAVLQAHDERLSRPVWIFVAPVGTAGPSAARTAACRPSRPHWLQGGRMDHGDWNAVEAVIGAPLTVVASLGDVPWTQVKQWLLELAEELVAANAEDTLPKSSSLELIWIDRGGRLKLLDAPLVPLGATNADTVEVAASAPQRAVALLRAATELCTCRLALAPYARQFLVELGERPATSETLNWAVEQLRSAIHRPAELKWDDRLGVLAVSMWLEFCSYVPLVMVSTWFVSGWIGRADLFVAGALAAILLLVPAAMGYAFRGGPVFRLTGIEVVRADGRPAGRWRCAWRSLVAWLPTVVFYVMVGTWARRTGAIVDFSLLMALLGSEFLAVGSLIGVAYAVARPQCGVQDLLAGTRLAPK